MTQLIEQVEVLIRKPDVLNTSEKEQLGDLFSQIIKWNDDNNDFEDYYQSFSQMMAAMCQSDFSKQLPVNGFKKNLLNFIALGLNTVNEELKENSMHKSFYNSVEDVSPYGIIFTNTEHEIIDVNQKTLDKFSYEKEHLLGKHLIDSLIDTKEDTEKILNSTKPENIFFCTFKESNNVLTKCKLALKPVYNQTQHVGYSFIIFEFGEQPKFTYECPVPFCNHKSS